MCHGASLVEVTIRTEVVGLLTDMEYSRVRDSTWTYLTSTVTTRTAVGLVDVQGNYSTLLE